MRNILMTLLTFAGICFLVSACTGDANIQTSNGLIDESHDCLDEARSDIASPRVSWPSALPNDGLQPWEVLGADGFAVANTEWLRGTSAINQDSDFTPGVERHFEDGDVSDYGEASRLASGIAGDGDVSYAIYRILGGGNSLGVVTADVNVHTSGVSSQSEYWLGVADYGKGRWSWHGPFTDSHVRLQMPNSSYASSLGNFFVTVVAFDGASLDVVGIGVNPRDFADTTAPATPGALTHTDYIASSLLEWIPVSDSDIAGYRVYSHSSAFFLTTQDGVEAVNYLIGDCKFLMTGLEKQTYVRIAAVDISGNESPLSETVICTPIAGNPIEANLEVDVSSGMVGDTFHLTAVGGATYDFDLDGDGSFDIAGNVSGTVPTIAAQTGIIRPLVRANSSDGTSIALGAVSLIVSGNSRPIALAYSDIANGNAPLRVNFSGNGYDYDGTVISYSWDFDGDGTWDYSHASNPAPPTHVYETGGVYNAKLRVTDDSLAWDIDTIAIHVKEFVGFDWSLPGYYSGQMYPDFAIIDGNPAFTYYDASDSTLYFLRATNARGTQWNDPIQVDAVAGAGMYSSLTVVNGAPAIAYYDGGAGLCYMIADNPQGTTWSSARVEIDPVGVDTKVSLKVVDGNPAIGWISGGGAMYIRADSIDGFSWGNVPVTVDNSGGLSPSIDMEVIDGNPALAYYDTGKVQYVRSTTSTGNVAGNWADPRVNISGVANCNGHVALEEVAGRPAISYWETTGSSKVAYHRALNSTGQTGLDWPAGFITVATGSGCGQYSNMGIVNGVPAVCFYMTEGMVNYYYCSASNPEGTSWDNPIGIHDGINIAVGPFPVVLENNGAPYIGGFNQSNTQLFFARPVFE